MGEHVRRGPRWIRAARIAARIAAGVVVAGLVVYLVLVGLDRADKVASSISGVIAVALFLASLLPGRAPAPLDIVEGSGAATATAGGHVHTGIQTARASGGAHVVRSGDARADGPGSIANTGITHGPDAAP